MTLVKICGLSSPSTLEAALDAGADYVGFVLFPKSPRNVDVKTAQTLCAQVGGRAKTVALVVDPDDALLGQLAAQVKPDIVQLHGHEDVRRVAHIKRVVGRPVWKAVAVAARADLETAAQFEASVDAILFDSKPPDDLNALPGGNGLSFDWRILGEADQRGNGLRRPYVLAGGLTPDNVGAAVRLIDPPIVDVSSGVESAPGVKDAKLIQSFILAAKTAKQSN